MKKPTELAVHNFRMADNHADKIDVPDPAQSRMHLALTLDSMCAGLEYLATGLRATYVLLDEVKNLLERQDRGPR